MNSRLGVTATTDMAVLTWRPRVSAPATYHLGTPRNQSRGTVARLHAHLRGLATAIHEIFGLARTIHGSSKLFVNNAGESPRFH